MTVNEPCGAGCFRMVGSEHTRLVPRGTALLMVGRWAVVVGEVAEGEHSLGACIDPKERGALGWCRMG